MNNSFRTYGVKESHTVISELDLKIEEIAVNGLTIPEDVLSRSQLEKRPDRLTQSTISNL